MAKLVDKIRDKLRLNSSSSSSCDDSDGDDRVAGVISMLDDDDDKDFKCALNDHCLLGDKKARPPGTAIRLKVIKMIALIKARFKADFSCF